MKISHLLFSTLLILTFQTSFSQGITKNDLVNSWEIMTKMVIESAEAMPEKYYQYTPGKPVRNFANQLNHTTMSNIGLGSMVFGKMPVFKMPDRKNPPLSKKAVLDIMKKSFGYFKQNLEELKEEDLLQKIKWGRPGSGIEITRMKGVLILYSHLQREHGKTMMYLRAKGIKPPTSGSWKF